MRPKLLWIKLLWIYGPAGFGKTILCARIIQRLRSVSPVPVVQFFFSLEAESRADPFVAIRSWVSQLVSQDETSLECARQARNDDLGLVATRATVVSLLSQLAHVVPGCIFAADGLDECTCLENSNASVESFIRGVTNAVAGTDTRILFVSRAEPAIRRTLSVPSPTRVLEYQISFADVWLDTRAFSRHIVDRKLSNKTDKIRSFLSNKLADRCGGQFLWLKMQEKSLRSGRNQLQLQRAIEETPTGLDSVYERDWDRISQLGQRDRHRVIALLRWAAFALRPLTVLEITEAVLIDGSEDLWDELPDQVDDEFVDGEIVHLGGPLLEVKPDHSQTSVGQQTVHLTHFTVRQFLLRNLPNYGCISQNHDLWGSCEKLQNTLLAKACLRYIGFRQTWQDIPKGDPCLGQCLRQYAATTWYRHIRSGLCHDAETTPIIVEFLSRSDPISAAWRTFVDSENTPLLSKDLDAVAPSPLYYAVILDLMDAALFLSKQQHHSFSDNGSRGKSILDILCASGCPHLAKATAEKGTDVTTGSQARLLEASQKGHIEEVKLLLDTGADATIATSDGWTSLSLASWNGQVEVVKLLLNMGASTTVATSSGWTPLHAALIQGHLDVAKLLLNSGADLSIQDSLGWAPLNVASTMGHLEIVRLLLDGGAKPDVRNMKGSTPLHGASWSGHVEVVEMLLDAGADVIAIDNAGLTPLDIASDGGHVDVVRVLLKRPGEYATKADFFGRTALFAASKGGHYRVVQLLLADGRINPGSSD